MKESSSNPFHKGRILTDTEIDRRFKRHVLETCYVLLADEGEKAKKPLRDCITDLISSIDAKDLEKTKFGMRGQI